MKTLGKDSLLIALCPAMLGSCTVTHFVGLLWVRGAVGGCTPLALCAPFPIVPPFCSAASCLSPVLPTRS